MNTQSTPRSRGRPKDPDKREAIFQAAQYLFPRHGYAHTSMDHIAKQAGVSKLTLYSHFKDKEELFTEALKSLCASAIRAQDIDIILATHEPAHSLFVTAQIVTDMLIRASSVQTQRAILAEAATHTAVSAAYINTAMGGLIDHIIYVLKDIEARHGHRFPDPMLAATLFYGMVKGQIHPRFLYHVQPLPDRASIENYLRAVVSAFLRIYPAP